MSCDTSEPAVTIYTSDGFPIIMDWTRVFSGIGGVPATISGDSLATIKSICFEPSDMTVASSAIIASGLKVAIVPTGGTGTEDGTTYKIVGKFRTTLGYTVSWQDEILVKSPAC